MTRTEVMELVDKIDTEAILKYSMDIDNTLSAFVDKLNDIRDKFNAQWGENASNVVDAVCQRAIICTYTDKMYRMSRHVTDDANASDYHQVAVILGGETHIKQSLLKTMQKVQYGK